MKALVNDVGMKPGVARQVITDWDRHNTPPLSDRELDQVITSALKYANRNRPGCKNTITSKAVVLKPPSGKPSSGVRQRIEDSISGKRASIPWLWPEIDRLTNALLPAALTLICGEPGSSKSFIALETATFWHELGIKVAVLEIEETVDYHLHRLLGQRTGLPGRVVPKWCKANPEKARKAYTDYEEFLDSFGR